MKSPDTKLGGPAPLASFPEQTRDAVLEALADTASTLEKTGTSHISRRAFLKGLAFLVVTSSPLWAVACKAVAAQPVPPTAETGAATVTATAVATQPARPTLDNPPPTQIPPEQQAKGAYESLVLSSLKTFLAKVPDSQKQAMQTKLEGATLETFVVPDKNTGNYRGDLYQFADKNINFTLVTYPDASLAVLATTLSQDKQMIQDSSLINFQKTLGKVPVLGVDVLTGNPKLEIVADSPAMVTPDFKFQALEYLDENAMGFDVASSLSWQADTRVASLNIMKVGNTPTPLPSPTRPAPAPSGEKENIYYPQVKTVDSAPVYSGPGNLGYENPTSFPKDSQVKVMGVFGDFYKVSYTDKDGKPQEVWVYGKSLDSGALTFNQDFTAQLAPEAVPWQTAKNIGIKGYNNSGNSDWYGRDGTTLKIQGDGPFGVTLNLNGVGNFAAVSLSGRVDTPGKPWGEGVSRLYAVVENGKNIVFEIRYGPGDSNVVRIRPSTRLSPGEPFSIIFSDSQGKKFSIVDSNGKVVREVDVVNGLGQALPNGLFPDKKLYPGMLISPRASLTTNQLSLTTPPSGHWENPPAPKPPLVLPEPPTQPKSAEKVVVLSAPYQNEGWYISISGRYEKVELLDDETIRVWVSIKNKDGSYELKSLDWVINDLMPFGIAAQQKYITDKNGVKYNVPDFFWQTTSAEDTYQALLKYMHTGNFAAVFSYPYGIPTEGVPDSAKPYFNPSTRLPNELHFY